MARGDDDRVGLELVERAYLADPKVEPAWLRQFECPDKNRTSRGLELIARLHESLGDIPPAEYEQHHPDLRVVATSLRSPYGLAPRGGDTEDQGTTTLTIESTRPN